MKKIKTEEAIRMKNYYDKDYFEKGPQSGKSLYQNYRWLPELTFPLAHHVIKRCNITQDDRVTDFGCAKGYLVKAMRMCGYNAHGVDISEYAISQADEDTRKYLTVIEPNGSFIKSDWVICKDILEHIPYDNIVDQLKTLRKCSDKIMLIVPLGENGRYNIPAYEADKSHFIRETSEWWNVQLSMAGFSQVLSTYDLKNFKDNWADVHPKGNLLYIGE